MNDLASPALQWKRAFRHGLVGGFVLLLVVLAPTLYQSVRQALGYADPSLRPIIIREKTLPTFAGPLQDRSWITCSSLHPKLLYCPAVSLPESRSPLRGSALLRFDVLESGETANVEILVSSGRKALDDAFVASLQLWRFSPSDAKQTMEIPMEVRIDDGSAADA